MAAVPSIGSVVAKGCLTFTQSGGIHPPPTARFLPVLGNHGEPPRRAAPSSGCEEEDRSRGNEETRRIPSSDLDSSLLATVEAAAATETEIVEFLFGVPAVASVRATVVFSVLRSVPGTEVRGEAENKNNLSRLAVFGKKDCQQVSAAINARTLKATLVSKPRYGRSS